LPLERLRAAAQAGFELGWWRELQTMGLPAILVPEAQGGLGLGVLDAAVAAEALGWGCVPGGYASVAVMAPLLVRGCASATQQTSWLAAMARGEMRIAVALDTSDAAPPLSLARGRLTGRASGALDGDGATHFLVMPGNGHPVLVDAAARGVKAQVRPSLDRTRSLCDIDFDDAAADVLDTARDAPAVAQRALRAGRIVLAADALGAAQRMLDSAVAWAGERVQFGRVVGSFQGLKHTLAEAVTMLEPCRALVWQAAHAHDQDASDAALLACHAKAHVGDVTREVARMSTEAHGGMGFTELLGLHFWFKRCAYDRQVLGTPARCRDEAAHLQGWADDPPAWPGDRGAS
jgi:alkylation response protein AidB-like acyl-CoA dehydrogenase